MMWFVGLGTAFGIKFSSSIDDVMWLTPFLTSKSSRVMRMQNSAIYISVCLLQTLIAMGIAYSSHEALDLITGNDENVWSTEKILTVGAGVLLACYSVKLGYEYIQELRGGDDEEGKDVDEASDCEEDLEEGEDADQASNYEKDANAVDDIEKTAYKTSACTPSSPEMVEANELTTKSIQSQQSHALLTSDQSPLGTLRHISRFISGEQVREQSFLRKEMARQRTLFVIALIGSVDDLTLFVPMLVGKSFDLAQLMLGAFCAALVIVTICLFIGLCKPVAELISKIPLAAIVVVFAVTLLVKGFGMDDENGTQ